MPGERLGVAVLRAGGSPPFNWRNDLEGLTAMTAPPAAAEEMRASSEGKRRGRWASR